MNKIHLSPSSRVFLVEDSPERVEWFKIRLGSRLVGVYKDPGEAVNALRGMDLNDIDVFFLDHDLGGPWMPPYSTDVAWYIRAVLPAAWNGSIIIHSLNPAGQEKLRRILRHFKGVHVWPFGTFEIFEIIRLSER